jgi:spore coat polysaccharide biosynthesis protein SpsF
MPLAGEPALFRMVERVRRSATVDEVVVATTVSPADDAVAGFCDANRIRVYRGSEEDVLLRVLEAARHAEADLIVELTGDCPLVDPGHIDAMVRLFQEGGHDYVYNRLKPGYPDGLDVQVFPTSGLAEVDRLTRDPVDRTHVSCYFYNHPGKYRLGCAHLTDADEEYWPELALTLDEAGDYRLISRIFETLMPVNPAFSALDALRLLRKNPDWLDLNRHIRRKSLEEG